MSKTAGIIIVGDEILKGRVVDTNSPFIVKQLYNLGVKVRKLSVVPDEVKAIAEEVSAFSKQFDFVITTGGIGPTHDDLTYIGVAEAFRDELVLNEDLKDWVFSFTSERSTDIVKNPALRMATVPKSSRLINYNKRGSSHYFLDNMPIVCVSNVHIFPGIPSYLQYLFVKLEHIFTDNGKYKNVFFDQCLYLNVDELNILLPLNHAVEKFKDSVTFGSYPVLDNDSYLTKITLESPSKEKLWEAEEYFISLLPKGSVVKKDTFHINDVIASVHEKALGLSNRKLVENVKISLQILEQCFKTYNLSDLCISFNGGKDCTVLLHLTCAVLWLNPKTRNIPLQAWYISYDDPFPEVELFITGSVKRYNLNLQIVHGSIKDGLASILCQKPNLKAMLMGTRRNDPYSESLKHFQMTDPNWPQVMRVSPILDWSYQDIWMFLRELDIPYCSLYDGGYTSIGSQHNTAPNPRLKYTDKDGKIKYQPAYLLEDEKSERSGRN